MRTHSIHHDQAMPQLQEQDESEVLIMWERTEITAGRIQCTCGRPMEPMWEEKNGKQRATVFHCEHCYEDRELVREVGDDGRETVVSDRRYFFG